MNVLPDQETRSDSASRGRVKQAEILAYSASVIAREGYEKASIRKIAAAMGMSISALYYYFSSKEDLLLSIQYNAFETVVRRLEERLDGVRDPQSKLYLLVENHLEYFLKHLDESVICSREINALTGGAYEKVFRIRRRYYQIALGIVGEIKARYKDCALQNSLATLNLFGMLNWIYMWYDPEKDRSYRVIAKEIYNLFLSGIKSKSRSGPASK
jgi:TetR/AcrR family transcriptional regulator